MGKFIWLIGENIGRTANNNSYYFWRHIIERKDDIDKYFVLEKNKQNIEFYRQLPEHCQKFVVWKDTVQHLKLYIKADLFFVALSYRDVRPEKVLGRKLELSTEKPVIYLQHGTLAMKTLGYNGRSYNNNFFRFVYYNKLIAPTFQEVNGFKPYQLYYGEYHPRYIETVKRFRAFQPQHKRILWFLTWREYMGNNLPTKILLKKIQNVITNPELLAYLDRTNTDLVLCVHTFFDETKISMIRGECTSKHIIFEYAADVDVMDEIVQSNVMITDYSSVGFDATLLNKPVILFQPDMEDYLKKRQLYCTIEELNSYNITKVKVLIETLINETYTVNPFFRSRLPEKIDYDYIAAGKHIDKMYDDFANIQRHKITFIGYNFYGIGGTVFATRSLAEAFLEKGYLVQLLSLKKNQKPKNMPYALNMYPLYDANRKSPLNLFKRHFYRRKKLFSYLKYDKDIVNLKPYAGYELTKWLKTTNSETVISTRESLHLFLNEASSDSIKNKIYFFHCPVEIFESVFPNILGELNKCDIGKAVFVTETNRQKFIEDFGFQNYKQYIVLGNCLESSRSISREEILPVEEKDVYRGIYLLRISQDRKPDIDNLIGYGKYLRDHNIDSIKIDVFGTGDYVDEFIDTLVNEDLTDYICYNGSTPNGPAKIREHDAVVDFSLNHSFGMPYIEGIMNGKMVFCEENQGSKEVMSKIPSAYIRSYEDLTQKILGLPEITLEQLQKYYDIISEKYSRETLAEEMTDYLDLRLPDNS